MTTKADLRLMVLSHLTVIDETVTTIPPETSRRMDLWLDGSRATLLEKGLCWWDEDDIPAAVTIPLSQYVAALSCAAFGKRGKGYEQQEVPARLALAALKSTEARPTTQAKYY